MTVNFISLESLIPSYKKMVGSESFDSDTYGNIPELDLLEWGNEAVGKLLTATQKVHKLVVLPVRDYRAMLPKGFLAVIQAAYRAYPEKRCRREEIVQWTQNVLDGSGCKVVIDLECPSCREVKCTCESPMVTVDVNEIFKASHPEYYYGYMANFTGYGNTFGNEKACKYTDEFRLMRRTSNTFYNIPYHIGNCVNFSVDSAVEYDIHPVGVDGFQISTTFKEGEVLIAYISEYVDPQGWRMVPNVEEAIEAVLAYMDERVGYRYWRKNKGDQVAFRDYQMLKTLRSQALARAVSTLKMPDKDKWENFLNTHWKQLIPYWSYDSNRNLHNPNRRDPGDYWAGIRPDYNFGY